MGTFWEGQVPPPSTQFKARRGGLGGLARLNSNWAGAGRGGSQAAGEPTPRGQSGAAEALMESGIALGRSLVPSLKRSSLWEEGVLPGSGAPTRTQAPGGAGAAPISTNGNTEARAGCLTRLLGVRRAQWRWRLQVETRGQRLQVEGGAWRPG
jgi:hypothetical protein